MTLIKSFVYKSLNLMIQYFVNKAGFPPGTRRQRSDGIYVKQPDGTWIKEIKNKPKKKEELNENLQNEAERYIQESISEYKVNENIAKEELNYYKDKLKNKYGEDYNSEIDDEEKKELNRLQSNEYKAVNETINQYRKKRKEFVQTKLKYKDIKDLEENSNIKNNEWYHGTFGIFDKFDKNMQGKNWNIEASKLGVNMTNNKEEALQYGDIIKKIKINKGNNLKVNKQTMLNDYEEYIKQEQINKLPEDHEDYEESMAESEAEDIVNGTEFINIISFYTEKAKKEGYDSITMTGLDLWDNIENTTENTVIFDSNNIEILDNAI